MAKYQFIVDDLRITPKDRSSQGQSLPWTPAFSVEKPPSQFAPSTFAVFPDGGITSYNGGEGIISLDLTNNVNNNQFIRCYDGNAGVERFYVSKDALGYTALGGEYITVNGSGVALGAGSAIATINASSVNIIPSSYFSVNLGGGGIVEFAVNATGQIDIGGTETRFYDPAGSNNFTTFDQQGDDFVIDLYGGSTGSTFSIRDYGDVTRLSVGSNGLTANAILTATIQASFSTVLTIGGGLTQIVRVDDDLEVTGTLSANTITSRTANTSLFLSGNGTGIVQVNDNLSITGDIISAVTTRFPFTVESSTGSNVFSVEGTDSSAISLKATTDFYISTNNTPIVHIDHFSGLVMQSGFPISLSNANLAVQGTGSVLTDRVTAQSISDLTLKGNGGDNGVYIDDNCVVKNSVSALQDVNAGQGTFIADSHLTGGVDVNIGFGAGQMFTGDGRAIKSVTFNVNRNSMPGTSTVRAELWTHGSGTYGVNATPGTMLVYSETRAFSDLPLSGFTDWTFNFSGSQQMTLVDGTYYAITLIPVNFTNSTTPRFSADNSGTHSGNRVYNNGSWIGDNIDLVFTVNTVAPLCSFEGSTGTTYTDYISGTSDTVVTITDDLVVSGNLTVQGTTTTIDTTTLIVEDKNIELGAVTSPNTSTADGGGITLLAGLGASDPTITWINSTNSWTFNREVRTNSLRSVSGSLTLDTPSNNGVIITDNTWVGGLVAFGGTGLGDAAGYVNATFAGTLNLRGLTQVDVAIGSTVRHRFSAGVLNIYENGINGAKLLLGNNTTDFSLHEYNSYLTIQNENGGGQSFMGFDFSGNKIDVYKNLNISSTITAGTWQGTQIGVTYGGTGLTTVASGDILYASAVDTIASLAKGTDGQILSLAGGFPSWVDAPLSGGFGTWVLKDVADTGFTAVVGEAYMVDTSANTGVITMTLPSTGLTLGDTVTVHDMKGSFDDISPTKSVTTNNTLINGINQTWEMNIANSTTYFVYVDPTFGWRVIV